MEDNTGSSIPKVGEIDNPDDVKHKDDKEKDSQSEHIAEINSSTAQQIETGGKASHNLSHPLCWSF